MRYRPPRFPNRKRKAGWLPPSLEARVDQTLHTWVQIPKRTLLGYEVRTCLLEPWGRRCVHCRKTDVPLPGKHIVPKARGGSNRLSNLTIACAPCNLHKGPRTATEFGYPDIQAQAQKPLRDAAMMNATRWRLYEQLKAIGLPIESGSGGRTKPQRIEHSFPQEHYFAALCVGESTPAHFTHLPAQVQRWTAKGRGTRQLGGPDAYGFPIRHRARQQGYFGFQTGDLVRAVVPTGKYAGSHTGRVLVRSSGRVDITTDGRRVAQGIAYKPCRILQRNGGWVYEQKPVSA